jgi:hypothetical protein
MLEQPDWEKIIKILEKLPGDKKPFDKSIENCNPEYLKIYKKWTDANFNLDSIQWVNFYPGKDFDWSVVEYYKKQFNFVGLHRAWISKVSPGYMAAWHWDVDDKEQEYLSQGKIDRYSVMMQDCELGQVFYLDKNIYHSYNANFVIHWNPYNAWHCGLNGSMKPKYMLHVLGY